MDIICTESTADGDNLFGVDTKNTYNFIVNLERFAFNEADYWGGFQYNIDLAVCNASFTEPYNSETLRVITQADILPITEEVKRLVKILRYAEEGDEEETQNILQGIYQDLMYS